MKTVIYHKVLHGALIYPLLFTACRSSVPSGTEEPPQAAVPTVTTTPAAPVLRPGGRPAAVPSPPVYIYKMRKDYSKNVPVIMNPERTKIISYPAPSDLVIGGRLMLPTPLHDGYWLDNRGISPHTAFLSYTYEEYSRLAEAPSMQQLRECIIDKNPFTEIRTCGQRRDYKNIVTELNALIDTGFNGPPPSGTPPVSL